MNKKDVGGLLILLGLVLLSGSYFLFLFFVILGVNFIIYLWIAGFLITVGLISVLIGGILEKKDLTYWLVLTGVIFIFGAILLQVFYILIGGIFLSFSWIIIILIFTGVACLIMGSLLKDRQIKK